MQKETDRHRSQKERNLLAHNGIQYPGFQSNELDSEIVKKADILFSDLLPLFYLSQYGNEDFLSELITKACGR